MHKQIPAWQLAKQSLLQNKGAMLLYVLESISSSPGRQGFCMVVNEDGLMSGSVGGGIMEHKFVELAKAKLKGEEQVSSVHQQLHDKTATKNQSGMICSGEQTIFFYRIQETDMLSIDALLTSLHSNNNGTLELSPSGIRFIDKLPSKDFSFQQNGEDDFLYREKSGYKHHLHVIGGGHCSLAFCRLMSSMDFYIHLYDDRKELNTFEQNDHAHEKHLVNDYQELHRLVQPSGNCYIVIMTFGYRTDGIALRALLNKPFTYFGVLGSRNKIAKMFRDLLDEGISQQKLDYLHAPVGIAIKSQTPEEIAISIAAEIIQVKNKFLV